MKIFSCLLFIICACNATFLSLLQGKDGVNGGGSHNDVQAHAHSYSHNRGHYNSYSHGGSSHIIKLIFLKDGSGASNFDHAGASKSFKVINQNGAFNNGPSGFGYSHGGSDNYNLQLYGILPQILQLIMQVDGTSGGDHFNSQLVTNFGGNGKVFINKKNGIKDYYNNGHVVQSGVLKVIGVKESNVQSKFGPTVYQPPVHSSSVKGHSVYGPPQHGW